MISSLKTYGSAYSIQESQQIAHTNHKSSGWPLLNTWVVMMTLEPPYDEPIRGGVCLKNTKETV